MTSISIDPSPEKKRYLLEMMSIGLLDRDGARELKSLLQNDIQKTSDTIRRTRLSKLIRKLDDYISGKIDLMMEPYVPTPSNVA